MNDFRRKLLGDPHSGQRLLRSKQPREKPSSAAEEESFANLAIHREAVRSANHRDGDRHRLESEQALLIAPGGSRHVTLVNLSGGGAMIEGAAGLSLWDRVELELGSISRLEAVVRWLRGDRAGLEFAHETRIQAGEDEVAATLREVIARSFPDVALEAAARRHAAFEGRAGPSSAAASGSAAEPEQLSERELRHPLIWTGVVHHNHQTIGVRLRNISRGGALIESGGTFPPGAELLLDLEEAGAIFSTVHWAHGDQAGLRFHTPYDLARLAKARPEIAGPRWVAPEYLREDRSANSPWGRQWGRSDLAGLHDRLEQRRR